MDRSIIDKVETEIEVAETKEEKKKRIKEIIKYIVVIVLLLGAATLLGIQVYNRFVPPAQYKKAVALYEEGKTKEALIIFEKLGDFNSSEYYVDTICSENMSLKFDHCEVGDEIRFGKYNFEDVEWVVIDIDENEVILISKYIIDSGEHPEEEWFENFTNKAFSSEEQSIINDVYLLNKSDFEDFISEKKYSKTKPTEYALQNEEYNRDSETGYGWWIEATKLYSSDQYYFADQSGVGVSNYKYDYETLGIRPAVSIELK